MTIRVAIETDVASSWANGEEPERFEGVLLLGKAMSLPDASDQEQLFSKADFERALKKVSRKIKK